MDQVSVRRPASARRVRRCRERTPRATMAWEARAKGDARADPDDHADSDRANTGSRLRGIPSRISRDRMPPEAVPGPRRSARAGWRHSREPSQPCGTSPAENGASGWKSTRTAVDRSWAASIWSTDASVASAARCKPTDDGTTCRSPAKSPWGRCRRSGGGAPRTPYACAGDVERRHRSRGTKPWPACVPVGVCQSTEVFRGLDGVTDRARHDHISEAQGRQHRLRKRSDEDGPIRTVETLDRFDRPVAEPEFAVIVVLDDGGSGSSPPTPRVPSAVAATSSYPGGIGGTARKSPTASSVGSRRRPALRHRLARR